MYKVKYIDISLNQGGFILFLAEKENGPALPLTIGISEAHSISRAMNYTELERPLSHDLFKNILNLVSVDLIKVIIDKYEKKIYYSHIYLKTPDGIQVVDSRPSDAVALALRYNAPIYIDAEVMRSGGKVAATEGDAIPVMRECEGPDDVDELCILKGHLADAVAKENYEEAALLRDRIEKLEGH